MHQFSRWINGLWTSRFVFCVIVAVSMVVLRLALFDYNMFFTLNYFPNHDMYQGAAFFTTDMHAIRLTGDLAWWGPQSLTGYAQYYQSFLSPLAPTPGYILHIVWSQLIRVLSLFNLALPEYIQYLIITYIVTPFFAFFSFTLFASFLFRSRGSLILLALVYTLSGIGLWNSAWFYFQEPAVFFAVMAGFLAVLQRPSAPRFLFALAVILIQIAAFNYWTLYNLFFYVILIVGYLLVYPQRVWRLINTILRFFRWRRLAAVGTTALTLIVALTWIGLIAEILREQSSLNVRTTDVTYTIQDAQARIQELRTFTVGLFEPVLNRTLTQNSLIPGYQEIPMHDARYLGVFLLPFLAVFAVNQWRRVDRWLIFVAICVFIVCLAPPFLLSLWNTIPFMNHIVHLFYFYTQYWQLMVALLAARGFELIFHLPLSPLQRQRFRTVIAGLGIIAALILTGSFLASQIFTRNNVDLQSYLQFATILLITSVLVWQRLLTAESRRVRVAPLLVVLLCVADLSGYFVYTSQLDHSFTQTRWDRAPDPLPDGVQAAFAQPWPKVDPQSGFTGNLFANAPIRDYFWPNNIYMIPTAIRSLVTTDVLDGFKDPRLITQPHPITFYTPIHVLAAKNPNVVVHDYDTVDEANTLILNNSADTIVADPKVPPPTAPFTYQWREWSYNEFSWNTTMPADGWLSVHQLYDPYWLVTVDNQPVTAQMGNTAWMAFPVTAGPHLIQINYNPPSRRLYWLACAILEIGLLILVSGALLIRRRHRRRILPGS